MPCHNNLFHLCLLKDSLSMFNSIDHFWFHFNHRSALNILKRRLKMFRVIAVIVPNCWINMLLQVKSSSSLSRLFFTCLINRKNRAVETCRTSVMLSIIFARVRIPQGSYKVSSTFIFWGLYFFSCAFELT